MCKVIPQKWFQQFVAKLLQITVVKDQLLVKEVGLVVNKAVE